MTHVLIGIGSNLGDPKAHVESAIKQLSIQFHMLAASALYETEPVGFKSRHPFINAVSLVETDLSPEALLEQLLQLELAAGRTRNSDAGYTSRTLDLDIILYGDEQLQTELVTVPHPRFRERRFILEPAAAICPEMKDPVTGESIQVLLAACTDRHTVNALGSEVTTD